MIYQSMSGDAKGTRVIFTMTGGSLAYTGNSCPLFYVTNSTGDITLKGASVSSASGIKIESAEGNLGAQGSNEGSVVFTGDGETLNGSLVLVARARSRHRSKTITRLPVQSIRTNQQCMFH